MVFEYYLDITFILWHCIMLHCIALHLELCRKPMVATVPIQHRFIGHEGIVYRYLVGYEGRSSYASICIHHWFGIEMQLDTLLGTKAGVHLHPYAYIVSLAEMQLHVNWYAFFNSLMLDVMEICCYKRILCPCGDTHCNVAYESWIYHMCAYYIHLLYCMDIWILVDMVATKIIW